MWAALQRWRHNNEYAAIDFVDVFYKAPQVSKKVQMQKVILLDSRP